VQKKEDKRLKGDAKCNSYRSSKSKAIFAINDIFFWHQKDLKGLFAARGAYVLCLLCS
jgi:hypothetical protein